MRCRLLMLFVDALTMVLVIILPCLHCSLHIPTRVESLCQLITFSLSFSSSLSRSLAVNFLAKNSGSTLIFDPSDVVPWFSVSMKKFDLIIFVIL